MKKRTINLKGVTTQTWVRTLVLIFALISNLFVITGKSSRTVNIEEWQEVSSYLLTVISALWSWWKNNSFTLEAQKADIILNGEDSNE